MILNKYVISVKQVFHNTFLYYLNRRTSTIQKIIKIQSLNPWIHPLLNPTVPKGIYDMALLVLLLVLPLVLPQSPGIAKSWHFPPGI